MKYIVFIGLMAVLIASCKPSMEMKIRAYDQEKEMPRFCFTERMFFYEVSKKDDALQLWVYSKDRLTIDQLISQPLHIYFAEKKKKHIIYHLRYKDLINSDLESKNKNGIQLKFVQYKEKDTIDLTNKYKFNVATDYNGSQYSLLIEFPESIIKEFEEPVLGIITDTPEPFKKKENQSAQTPQSRTQQGQGHSGQGYGQRQNPNQPHQYVRKIQDIELWFSITSIQP